MNYSLLNELSDKYNLSDAEVTATIEKVIADVLMKATNKDVECNIDRGEIYIYDSDKKILPISNVNKSIVRHIRSVLRKALYLQEAIKRYDEIKNLINTVVGGYIKKNLPDGSLYVELDSNKNIYGICKVENQPPKERGKYRLGEYYNFYVNRIVTLSEPVDNMVILSRTSKSLVVELLKKSVRNKLLEDIEIACENRIAGYVSKVRVSKRIPKECILDVSKELQERIIVKYQQNNK